MSATRVLVVGSGVAAVECALALHALAGSRVEIELLAPSTELVYRPSSVETPFGGETAPRVDLTRLVDELGVRLHHDSLAAVEPENHRVLTKDGQRLGYDALVVATGARSREAIPGAVTFRGPMSAGASDRCSRARWRIRSYASRSPRRRARAGCCRCTSLRCSAPPPSAEHGVHGPRLVAVTGEREPLELLGPAAGEAVRAALARAGVELVTSAVAAEAVPARCSSRAASGYRPTWSSRCRSSSGRGSPGLP